MDIHHFLLTLFLILVTARLLGELFARVGIPSVLGELSAGILLGVSGLGLIEVNVVLKVLAEIGIMLLLFEVGLETDIRRLREAGSKSLVVALFGAIFPFVTAFLIADMFFGLGFTTSLFVGGTLMATSIGITLRVLKDIGKDQTNIAQIVIGAAIIDDILGVVMLVFIYDYSISHELSWGNTFQVSLLIALFLILAPAAANLLVSIVSRFEPLMRVPGFVPTAIISLILLFAYLSYLSGAPEILGSFVAGIALSRRFFLPFGLGLQREGKDFVQKVRHSVDPIIHLFTPIFFVMVGLSVNLTVIDIGSWHFWQMALAFLVVAVLGKYLGALLITQRCPANCMLIGISMIPRGEVGLIFAEIGRINGILGDEIYAVLIFVIVVTTVVPPFLLKWLFRFECA
jgi:Kef-type K+ transport system membrane component KefB